MKVSSIFNSKFLKLSLSVLVLLSAFLFIFYSKNLTVAQSQRNLPKPEVTNKTQALRILEAKIDDNDKSTTHVVLKNVSNKAINGIYITEGPQGKGDSSFSQVDFLYSDVKDEISPGDTFDYKTSTDSLMQEDGLIVQAVFFKDGSAAGSVKFIQEVQDYRQGKKAQFERAVKLLDELLSSLTRQSFSIDNVKHRLSAFPLKESSKTGDFNSGLSSGFATLERDFEEINEKAQSDREKVKDGLLRLRAKLEKVISNI